MAKTLASRPLLNILIVAAAFATSLVLVPGAHAAAAGKVVFATGAAKAVASTGVSRALRRGDEVFSGDNLQTAANSRLQISLTDGAYVSVQPDSEYQIEDYQYSGKADGTEKAYYRLLKGGIRAVTGLIGKKNREAYKVRTAVATIGIRGTGHNTRLCSGDCPGKSDGLYHNTWEGITTVENNADSKDVPAGGGVFVKDINSSIQRLNQPSSVTALDTGKQKREEQEEEEEQVTLVSRGEQRSRDEGLQVVVVEDEEVREELDNPFGEPTSSTVLGGQALVGVAPDSGNEDDVGIIIFPNLKIFQNADGKPIGVFGIEIDDDDMGVDEEFLTFATIDVAGVLGVNDAALLSEIQVFLDKLSDEDIDFFLAKPAKVVEFATTPEGLSLSRWADGRIIGASFFADSGAFDEVILEDLTGFQSIHFIYGDSPGPIPTAGSATYNFTAGTQSTSVSGDSIGNGAIGGFIAVNFASASANISLSVDHAGALYSISGNLMIDDGGISDTGAIASTGAAGSACNPSCSTFIDGGFAGPAAPSMPNMPNNIGIEYDIQDTDVVTGVAGFSYELQGM